MAREEPTKRQQEELSKDFWWSPALDGPELATKLFADVRSMHKDQDWRFQDNIFHYGLYKGVTVTGGTAGERLSMARFLPVNSPLGGLQGGPGSVFSGAVFNVCRAIIDGAVNKIASRRPKPTFVVDGGDGYARKKARTMDRLVRGIFKSEDAYRKGKASLLDAAIFGTGAVKVVERKDRACLEHVPIDELVVDDSEGYRGEPRTLYHAGTARRSALARLFPNKAEKVLACPLYAVNLDGHVYQTEHVEVYEAWRLPSFPGSGDGRHVMAVSNDVLVDEKWELEEFPFVFLRWSRGPFTFWGDGIPFIIREPQGDINRLARRRMEIIRKFGNPKLVVRGNGQVSESAKDREMNAVRVPANTAVDVVSHNISQAISDLDKSIEQLKAFCYELTGVNEFVTGGSPPERVYAQSPEALQAFGEHVTERFSEIIGDYESFYCDLAVRLMEAGKRIAEREGSYVVRVSHGTFSEELDLKDVDFDRDRCTVKVLPTAQLPHTFSGKLETLEYLKQNGYIDYQTARDNLDIPDVQGMLDLEDAPLDAVQLRLDRMAETGEYLPPDELDDLASAIPFMTHAYHLLEVRAKDVQELESGPTAKLRLLIRQWLDDAQAMQAARQPQQPQAPAPGGAPPAAA